MIEIHPPYEDHAFRIEMWGDQIDRLRAIDALTGEIRGEPLTRLPIYPKSHYVLPAEQKERAIRGILEELEWWKPELEKQGKYIEAQRVWQRTMFDVEMMRTIGYCHGIENYSRHMSGRLPGRSSAHAARLRSRRIICCLSTSRIRRFRKFAGCTMATARESRPWWTTVFACRRRSITAR